MRPQIDLDTALDELRAQGQPEVPAALMMRILKDADTEQARQARARPAPGGSIWSWASRLLECILGPGVATGGIAAALFAAVVLGGAPQEFERMEAGPALAAARVVDDVGEIEIEAHMWLTGWPTEFFSGSQ